MEVIISYNRIKVFILNKYNLNQSMWDINYNILNLNNVKLNLNTLYANK
jgi:hypothetical protein